MKKLLAACVLVLALPAVAHAGDVAMRVQDVPLGARALQSAQAPMRFNMLGVHWQGPGSVEYRTRALRGSWRAWREVDDDARPDPGSVERDRTWRDGNLYWASASGRAQFRTHGRVTRLRAYYLWTLVTKPVARHVSLAGSPLIVPRSGWFADEKIKRAKPSYAPAVKLAVVHHTAGTNAYSPAQAAAIVRGIEVYHVKGNGWNDIGYNFLVDRFGNVYEGRAGGIEKNVIGAHAEGFNTGTTGVALIGNFAGATPPKAQQDALVKLLAWRLDVAHVDPSSTVVYTSGGNLKWRAGKPVTLRAISGHRDTGPSECPGAGAYRLIPSLTKRVALTGLPKLYTPIASGRLGGTLRFQARLSSALPWRVTVADQLGTVVATGKGKGPVVDWTWDAAAATKGVYRWSIDAGPTVRPATGAVGLVGTTPAPLLSGFVASPTTISPNADGTGDVMTVSFTLGAAAQVTAQVYDAGGARLVVPFSQPLAAGANAFQWGAHVLPDGRYRLVVTAKAGTKTASQSVDVVVDRTLTGLTATPQTLSPNGDGILDTMAFSFALAQSVPVRLTVQQQGYVWATPFLGQLGSGPHVLGWDGTNLGVRLADGPYDAVATITDQLGEISFTLPIVIDTTPPVLKLLDASKLRFSVNEPSTVTLLVNNQRIVKVVPKGTFAVPWQGGVATVSAVAQDAGGNVSNAVKGP